jgi:hypothetical protein
VSQITYPEPETEAPTGAPTEAPEDPTDPPATEAPTDAPATEAPTEEIKGCKSTVMGMACIPALVSGFGVALLRKRED